VKVSFIDKAKCLVIVLKVLVDSIRRPEDNHLIMTMGMWLWRLAPFKELVTKHL